MIREMTTFKCEVDDEDQSDAMLPEVHGASALIEDGLMMTKDDDDAVKDSLLDVYVMTRDMSPVPTPKRLFMVGMSPADSGFGTPSSKNSEIDPTERLAGDPWALPEIVDEDDTGPRWKEQSVGERLQRVMHNAGKMFALLGLLYMFICSLGFLSDAFRLVGGKAAGRVFSDSKVLQNPVAGLMIGVLGTVLLQSSSTSTSIVVGLVASEMLNVRQSIPIVMGANIGTSVTNTIVSVAHSGRRAEFRRAFAGATVHDMFNWLCVLIMLPLEVAFGYLYHTTKLLVNMLHISGEHKKPPKLLKRLTEPFTKLIVVLDKEKIAQVAMGGFDKSGENATDDHDDQQFTLVRRYCGKAGLNGTSSERCPHLFAYLPLSDTTLGLLLLALSLATLIICLVLIVKLLNSMLRGRVAKAIRNTINNDLPGRFAPLTGYVGIAIGTVMTILIQSSSVFTSTLTPLVAVGILSLERMYPLTLGANVGTTFTSMLAALASPPNRLSSAVQISLCHLLFNITGILIFFPIPFMRQAPLGLARILGNKTSKYRWFPLVYIATMFFLAPATVFSLSMAGPNVLFMVCGPVFAFFAIIILINVIQAHFPKLLPVRLRNWNFLPLWLHSLAPIDALFVNVLGSIPLFARCCVPADKSTALGSTDKRTESRHRLLGTSVTCTPAPSVAAHLSRLPSRAPSPPLTTTNRTGVNSVRFLDEM